MKSGSSSALLSPTQLNTGRAALPLRRLALGLLSVVFAVAFSGCETSAVVGNNPAPAPSDARQAESLVVREGDVVKIAFPGAPNLDTTQQVRRDGRITLALVGEFVPVGMTPAVMEQELAKLYASQIVSNEVSVTVVSSSYSVFVNGAVLRPGKISTDRPLSALEAVMEAGGFDSARANMKAVVIIRQVEGQTRNYTIDLQSVLSGRQSQPFMLEPSDIVFVPERFSWF